MITWLIAILLAFTQTPAPSGVQIVLDVNFTPARAELCEAPLDLGFEAVVQTQGNVNVRALPTTASGIVGTLRNGDTVKFWPPVTGTMALGTDVWYYIHLPESEVPGYVSGGAFKPPELSWGC